jgi:hypothetical protein
MRDHPDGVADRRIQTKQRRFPFSRFDQQRAGGRIVILERHLAELNLDAIEQQELLRQRAAQIRVAIALDRMLIKNLLHLLERHAELVGKGALRTMQDQIAALLWLGHGAFSGR